MPDATELCTAADLYAMLGLSSTPALLTLIKAEVEKWAKTYCGRDFLIPSTPYTEYYDGDGSNSLRLDQRPIVSITSIHSDPARLFSDATLIPASDLISNDTKGWRLGFVELLTFKFLKGLKSTKVIYSAGYSTVPEDLSYAVKLIIAKQYKVASKQMYAEGSQQVGDMTITLSPDAFPKDAMTILKAYRRMSA